MYAKPLTEGAWARIRQLAKRPKRQRVLVAMAFLGTGASCGLVLERGDLLGVRLDGRGRIS